MKAVAFSNDDISVIKWTFGRRIEDCIGFAIYRIDIKPGIETCLPALATFPGQDPTSNRNTAQDPAQKFLWKDVYAKLGGFYRYRIAPMAGTPGALTPMAIESLTTNIVQLSPDHGVLSAYFNRGILATAPPPDLKEVFDLIAGARQAVLFVVFEPRQPSIINAVAKAQDANPALLIYDTVTVSKAAEEFAVAIKSDAAGDGAGAALPAGQQVPIDYRVIPALGVQDPVGAWEKELNKAGFAVTHSKFVVIDPFSDGSVIITGSYNLGSQASYNNDENMAIIKGHRPLA